MTEVVVYHAENNGVPPEKIGWMGLFFITGMYSVFCFGGLVCLVGLNWHNKLSLLELLIFGIGCGVTTGIIMDFFMRQIQPEPGLIIIPSIVISCLFIACHQLIKKRRLE